MTASETTKEIAKLRKKLGVKRISHRRPVSDETILQDLRAIDARRNGGKNQQESPPPGRVGSGY